MTEPHPETSPAEAQPGAASLPAHAPDDGLGLVCQTATAGPASWDAAARVLLGVGPDEPWDAGLPPAAGRMVEAGLGGLFAPGGDTFETVLTKRAGGRLALRARRLDGHAGPSVVGTLRAIVEPSAHARSEGEDLARIEAQFRAVFEGANVGMIQLDPRSLAALRVNAKLCEIWGAPPEDILGHSVAKWTPDEDKGARDSLHRRLAAGEIMQEQLEKRYRRADGRVIWARVNLVSQVFGADIQATAMIEDITREKLAERRDRTLIELADRLRDASDRAAVLDAAAEVLGRTLDAARAGFAAVEPLSDALRVEAFWPGDEAAVGRRMAILSEYPQTMARLRRGEILAVAEVGTEPSFAQDHPAYAGQAVPAFIKVPLVVRGELTGILFAQATLPRPWPAGDILFAREVAERTFAALTRLQAEDHQRLLNRELSHRLKNTLAMVQAIVAQTLRNVTDIEAAKDALADRLITLGRAHDILLAGEREGAAIAAVLRGCLAVHDDGTAGRLSLDGPDLELGPKAALALALMVHELATNAAKYGAFSAGAGRVAIAWRRLEHDGIDAVELTWREAGGPPVSPPSRKGFGTRLIERGLAGAVGGTIRLDYPPEGVVCTVVGPLAGFTGTA